jgi:hypothetical protein
MSIQESPCETECTESCIAPLCLREVYSTQVSIGPQTLKVEAPTMHDNDTTLP